MYIWNYVSILSLILTVLHLLQAPITHAPTHPLTHTLSLSLSLSSLSLSGLFLWYLHPMDEKNCKFWRQQYTVLSSAVFALFTKGHPRFKNESQIEPMLKWKFLHHADVLFLGNEWKKRNSQTESPICTKVKHEKNIFKTSLQWCFDYVNIWEIIPVKK